MNFAKSLFTSSTLLMTKFHNRFCFCQIFNEDEEVKLSWKRSFELLMSEENKHVKKFIDSLKKIIMKTYCKVAYSLFFSSFCITLTMRKNFTFLNNKGKEDRCS